jgi:hypothetical protein
VLCLFNFYPTDVSAHIAKIGETLPIGIELRGEARAHQIDLQPLRRWLAGKPFDGPHCTYDIVHSAYLKILALVRALPIYFVLF